MTINRKYVGQVIYDRTSYGFIKCDKLAENTFYHYSQTLPIEQIHKGDAVEFELGEGRDGRTVATNVRLVRTEDGHVEK